MENSKDIMSANIVKKLEKYFGGWKKECLFFSSIPFITIGIFLFFNIFYRVVSFRDFFIKGWMVWVIALCLSLFFFLIGFYKYSKKKWIYDSIKDGTVIVKRTKIIKFVVRVSYSSSEKKIKDKYSRYTTGSMLKYYDSFNMYFLTSDGERKYKSEKYSNGDVVLVGDDVSLYDRQGPNTWLAIKGKKFSIGDEIDVYVDPKHKGNYIMDIDYTINKSNTRVFRE